MPFDLPVTCPAPRDQAALAALKWGNMIQAPGSDPYGTIQVKFNIPNGLRCLHPEPVPANSGGTKPGRPARFGSYSW